MSDALTAKLNFVYELHRVSCQNYGINFAAEFHFLTVHCGGRKVKSVVRRGRGRFVRIFWFDFLSGGSLRARYAVFSGRILCGAFHLAALLFR